MENRLLPVRLAKIHPYPNCGVCFDIVGAKTICTTSQLIATMTLHFKLAAHIVNYSQHDSSWTNFIAIFPPNQVGEIDVISQGFRPSNLAVKRNLFKTDMSDSRFIVIDRNCNR